MSRPIVAFLTDFGTRDAYVGVMKGVVLERCRDATLVDLSHEVPAHDIRHGARVLATCAPYYPDGAIFVAVVDPGVGSARRAIVVDDGRHRFVGPDNGLLSLVLDAAPHAAIVALTASEYQRPSPSRTFEGRDRFAPVAGHLAAGVPFDALGPRIDDPVRLTWSAPAIAPAAIVGVVDAVDHFGNLVTNIPRAALDTLCASGPVAIALADRAVPRLVATYAEVGIGEPCALIGSTDLLEIAIHGGRADTHFKAGAGTPVAVRRIA
ncbi:MAG: SAM-dependent chlorinase/fluorinase [Vicinamibacterales bacterium]